MTDLIAIDCIDPNSGEPDFSAHCHFENTVMQAFKGRVPSIAIAAFQPDDNLPPLVDLCKRGSPLFLLDTRHRMWSPTAGWSSSSAPSTVPPPAATTLPASGLLTSGTPVVTTRKPVPTLEEFKDEFLRHHRRLWRAGKFEQHNVSTVAFIDGVLRAQVRAAPHVPRPSRLC